jgi:hypothetical protein
MRDVKVAWLPLHSVHFSWTVVIVAEEKKERDDDLG